MASNNTFNAGQAQMRKDDMQDSHNQTNFLQETGTHLTNMAHGATEVGKGAALGTASIARGAVQGAANVAQGAADAIKNTFGMNSSSGNTDSAPSNHPSSGGNNPSMGGTAHASLDQSAYPSKPSHPHTPNL